MRITDAQLHVCPADSPDTPWPEWSRRYSQGKFEGWYPIKPERLREGMDHAGVNRAVIMVPTWFCGRDDFAVETAEADPEHFTAILRPQLNNPAEAFRLRELFRKDVVRGVRAVFMDDQFADASARAWFAEDKSEWLFDLAEELDFPVMLLAPRQTTKIGEVARRHPGMRIIIDQMNAAGQGDNEKDYVSDISSLLELERFSNIGVKVRIWRWNQRSPEIREKVFRPQMERIIKTFGANRCFWQTDFVQYPASTYSELIDEFRLLPFLSDRERELIMGEALSSWLQWP